MAISTVDFINTARYAKNKSHLARLVGLTPAGVSHRLAKLKERGIEVSFAPKDAMRTLLNDLARRDYELAYWQELLADGDLDELRQRIDQFNDEDVVPFGLVRELLKAFSK